jgi:phage baseplate assembly protein W
VSGEEVLIQSPSLYRLVRAPDGTLTLEVVVGTLAMYEVRVRLTEEEAASYAREGRAFADRMAQAICDNPRFGGRAEPA